MPALGGQYSKNRPVYTVDIANVEAMQARQEPRMCKQARWGMWSNGVPAPLPVAADRQHQLMVICQTL